MRIVRFFFLELNQYFGAKVRISWLGCPVLNTWNSPFKIHKMTCAKWLQEQVKELRQTDSVTTVWTLKQEDGDKHTVSGVYTSRPM